MRSAVTRTPENRCLACGYVIDSATATPDFPDESAPRPGDIAVCFQCAHIMLFADDLTLCAPTDDEMVAIAGDPEMIRAVEAIGRENKRRGK